MRTTIQNLRSLPPAAWVLFVGTFINRFGTFVMPFLVLYLTKQGYTIGQAGLASGAYGAGILLSTMIGGHLADSFGRRNTIVLSMFSSAAVLMGLSQARGFLMIALLTFLLGVTAELYRPASAALIADLVPQEQRVTAYGAYRFAINLGFAAGPATAGFLSEKSFFYLFAGDAITSTLYGFIAMFALPQGVIASRTESGWGLAFHAARSDRRFVLFLLASTCVTFVDFQMASTFALHVKEQGWSGTIYGLLISINGALIVLFELPITSFTQKLEVRRTIAAGYLLIGLGFALTGFAVTIPFLALTVVIWTVGEMIFSPVASAYVAGISPEGLRGRYMGLWGLTFSIGIALGPLLGLMLYQLSPIALWMLCGALGMLAAMLVLVEPREGKPTG